MEYIFRRPKNLVLYAEKAVGLKNQATHVESDLPVSPNLLDKYGDLNYQKGLRNSQFTIGELNGIFQYHSALLKKLYDQGIAEFSAFVYYKKGSLVLHNGNVWKALKDIEPSMYVVNPTVCNKLTEPTECGEIKEPSLTNGWSSLATEFDIEKLRTELFEALNDLAGSRQEITKLQDQVTRLQETVDNLVNNN